MTESLYLKIDPGLDNEILVTLIAALIIRICEI